jgi:DNA-binding MarR family transcriptional regulator
MRHSDDSPAVRRQLLDFITQLSPDADVLSMRAGTLLMRVAHTLYQLNESSLSAADISFAQFRLLMDLLFSEQCLQCRGLNPSTISERQGVSRNTISALVRGLEEQGWVRRKLDLEDRRRFIIELTDAGRELARKHAKHHFQTMSSSLSALTPVELEMLIGLLGKLAADPWLDPQGA